MEIFWSEKLKLPNEKKFQEFVQKQANRLMQGFCRYGGPDKRQKYLTRLKLEVKAYERTGNAEHLINIANYAHLEEFAPENKKFHFDNTVDSVTRGKI
jgi:hypothetical protein